MSSYDGLLSTRNAAIGGTLARSQLHAAIHAIPGVLGIDAITLDGIELPNIFTNRQSVFAFPFAFRRSRCYHSH